MSKSLNFEKLKSVNFELTAIGQHAEEHMMAGKHRDALGTLRTFAEILSHTVAAQNNISLPANSVGYTSLATVINKISSRRWRDVTKISEREKNLLTKLKDQGNNALHAKTSPLIVPPQLAEEHLKYAWTLGNWFLSTYSETPNFQVHPFSSPLDPNLKFDELSERRYLYELGGFEKREYHIIEGIAGSGKTYIAVEEAKRLSREKSKILVLVFNEPIKYDLRQRLKGIADVYNYPEYCDRVFKMVDPDFTWVNPKSEEFKSFFEIDLPQRFLEALKKLKDNKRELDSYDVIIIDEGQDFYPLWWEGIMKLALDECPARVYFFYDPDQNYNSINIDQSLEELKRVVKQATGKEFIDHFLAINLRNTQEIASKMYEIAGLRYKPRVLSNDRTPAGDDQLEEEPFSNPERERAWIREKLEYLTESKKVTANKIIIVGLHHFNKSIFGNDPFLGKFKVFNPQNESCKDDSHVEYLSSRRIKGLEYDYVIVTGFLEPYKLNDGLKLLLYLSISRAKQGLYVAYRRRKY